MAVNAERRRETLASSEERSRGTSLCPEQAETKTMTEMKTEHAETIPVIYYLTRNGQLEHPHLLEVPLSSSRGLFLRGKLNLFFISSNDFFVFQFSSQSDLLLRCDQKTRYISRRILFQNVLVVFEAVSTDDFLFVLCETVVENTIFVYFPSCSSFFFFFFQSIKHKFASYITINRAITCDFRRYKSGYVWQDLSDDDLIHPSQGREYILKGSEVRLLEASSSFRSCESSSSFSESKFSSETNNSSTDSNFAVAVKRNNQSWNSLEDLCRNVVYKAKISGEGGTNVATQTGERRRKCTDGGEEVSNSGVARTESLRSVDCEGAADLRDQTAGKSNRWKTSTVLMQLMKCNF